MYKRMGNIDPEDWADLALDTYDLVNEASHPSLFKVIFPPPIIKEKLALG